MKKYLIKLVLAFVLSVTVVSLNFWYEAAQASQELADRESLTINYDQETVFPGDGLIRFDQAAQNKPEMSIVEQNDRGEYIVELKSGHLWANFSSSKDKVNIVIGDIVLIPNQASFDLNFDGSRIDLNVYGGDVYVGFLEPDSDGVKRYHDWYSPVYVNMLLVPRQSQVDIPLSKIGEHLNVLLYSKLVKEFKYAAVAADSYDDPWISENLKADKRYAESVKQSFSSDVFDKGLQLRDGVIDTSIFTVKNIFTYVPGQREDLLLDALFEYLDDAIFYANSGELSESEAAMINFYAYRENLPSKVGQSDQYVAMIDQYVNKLSIFTPGDEQYDVLRTLLAREFVEGRDRYDVVNELWLNVYDAIEVNDLVAEQALDFYYEHFISTLGSYEDLDFYIDYIAYQNQLFDTLFLRESLFYRDAYFELKHRLELELIALYEDGQLKDELRQAFVSQKIDFLKRLRNFFFAGDVEVHEATQILARLIEEINDLMRDSSADLAVSELFEDRLSDISDFWGYLNSPEYHNSTIYGDNHEERYDVYLEEKEVILSFIDLQQEVLGEEVDYTLADVRDDIEEVFAQYEVVSEIKVGEIESVSQRYVDVEGVLGGFPFKASFDRDIDSVRDVMVYGELISEAPVKINNVLPLLQAQYSDLADLGEENFEELDQETNAQIIARIYIAGEFEAQGFEIEMSHVRVINQDNALYRVEKIVHEDYPNIEFTFDYDASKEVAENLFLNVYGSSKTISGEFTFEELAELAELEDKIYNEEDFEEEDASDKVLR